MNESKKSKLFYIILTAVIFIIAVIFINILVSPEKAHAAGSIVSSGNIEYIDDNSGDVKAYISADDFDYLKNEIDELFSELDDDISSSALVHQ